MRHNHRIAAKFQKLRKNHINLRAVQNHGIINSGELLDSKGNRHVRINKGAEPVCNFPVLHLYRTDFNDFILLRRKSGGFDIKNHIGIGKTLVAGILHKLL